MYYTKVMDTLMKADIFFFISSLATIVLTVLISIMLYYFIKAGKILYLISIRLQEHFGESEEFVRELKERLEENLVFRLFFPPARRKAESRKNDQ